MYGSYAVWCRVDVETCVRRITLAVYPSVMMRRQCTANVYQLSLCDHTPTPTRPTYLNTHTHSHCLRAPTLTLACQKHTDGRGLLYTANAHAHVLTKSTVKIHVRSIDAVADEHVVDIPIQMVHDTCETGACRHVDDEIERVQGRIECLVVELPCRPANDTRV